jgi:carbon starvation protein CstA
VKVTCHSALAQTIIAASVGLVAGKSAGKLSKILGRTAVLSIMLVVSAGFALLLSITLNHLPLLAAQNTAPLESF